MSGHDERTWAIAFISACVTQRSYFVFTAIWRLTYVHRNCLFGGSHEAAAEAPFCWLICRSVAIRFSGSLANEI